MYTDDKFSEHDDKTENNLKLIKEISLRPELFNYQLPTEQRTKRIRDDLWLECAKELHTTVYDCQRRWKNLRDTYHLYRQHHKNLLERWRYTESLSFLQNIHTVKARRKKNKIKISSSLDNGNNQHDIDMNIIDDYLELNDRSEIDATVKFENHNVENESVEKYYEESGNSSENEQQKKVKTPKFKRRRTKRSTKKSVLQNNDESSRDSDPIMIRNGFNESVLNNEKDEIDLFLDFLNKKIRKLSLNDINEIQRKFLDIVLEKESNLSKR